MGWHPTLLIVLGIANLPVYFFYWKLVFKHWEGFVECVRFWLTPNWISALRGEGIDDWSAEMTLWWYVLMCVGTVALEYFAIDKIFY